MSASSRLYYEIFESAHQDSEEFKTQHYTAYDYSKSKPSWDATFGKCMNLIWTVLGEQSSTDISGYDLFHMAQLFAVDVIAREKPLTINQAYQSMGYDMREISLDEIPF